LLLLFPAIFRGFCLHGSSSSTRFDRGICCCQAHEILDRSARYPVLASSHARVQSIGSNIWL
jgi:hypothetical protein